MSKVSTPPFTKEEMASELREILMVQASQIAHLGMKEAAWAYLGFECDLGPVTQPTRDEVEKIDLQRFAAWQYLSTACDYGFQVGLCWGYGESENHDIVALAEGITPAACYGDRSPYLEANSKCRHVVDLAIGRWSLEVGDGRALTVRQLALLAGMSEAAVRNSLSAEKIRTPVNPDEALRWLMARKGFIPTRTEENQQAFWVAHTRSFLSAARFGSGLQAILADLKLTPQAAAKKAGVKTEVMHALIAERHASADIESFLKIGAALNLDAPYFAGQAVEVALRRNG